MIPQTGDPFTLWVKHIELNCTTFNHGHYILSSSVNEFDANGYQPDNVKIGVRFYILFFFFTI